MKLLFLEQQLDNEIYEIAQALVNRGSTGVYIVGGAVRDAIFNRPSKDIDIEVFGIGQEALEKALLPFGRVDLVGESFAVTKLTTDKADYDFALPRRERKVGEGYTGFEVEVDPTMSLEQAAARRDLRMNAIYWDIMQKKIIDPSDGMLDIKSGDLRHVSPAFAEDPLRVGRVARFVSYYSGFTVADETVKLCNQLITEFHTISKERWRGEFEKMLVKGEEPSAGINFLRECRWSEKFHELHGVEVAQKWDDMIRLLNQSDYDTFPVLDNEKLILRLAELCFFMNNPKKFLLQINMDYIHKEVVELVDLANDIIKVMDYKMRTSQVECKKILSRIKYTSRSMLTRLMVAIPSDFWQPMGKDTFLYIQPYISDESLIPRVTGDDLMEMGMKQGKELGQLKKKLFQLQLEHNYNKKHLIELAYENI